jgi:hypothetical protein
VFGQQLDHALAGLSGRRPVAARPNAGRLLQRFEALLQSLPLALRKTRLDPFMQISVMADLVIVLQHSLDAIHVFLRGPTRHEKRRLHAEVAQQL